MQFYYLLQFYFYILFSNLNVLKSCNLLAYIWFEQPILQCTLCKCTNTAALNSSQTKKKPQQKNQQSFLCCWCRIGAPRLESAVCPAQLAHAQQSPLAPWPWLRECLHSHGTAQNRLLLVAQDSEPVEGGGLLAIVGAETDTNGSMDKWEDSEEKYTYTAKDRTERTDRNNLKLGIAKATYLG